MWQWNYLKHRKTHLSDAVNRLHVSVETQRQPLHRSIILAYVESASSVNTTLSGTQTET